MWKQAAWTLAEIFVVVGTINIGGGGFGDIP